jgi:hypothetical protein
MISIKLCTGWQVTQYIPDEGVDLHSLDIVKLLQGLLDLSLVCLDIDDEHQGVVLLNLLHGALSVERVDDDLVFIETGNVRDGLAGVLGRSGELESLGAVEGRRKTDFADLMGVDLDRISIAVRSHVGNNYLRPSKRTWQQHWLAWSPLPQHLLKLTHQQSLLKNSQYLLLLVRIPFFSCSYEAEIHFRNCKSRDEVVDVSKDADEQFNELERRLYLSSDPWGPFRGN